MTAREVLLRAADRIERFGWVQGRAHGDGGSCCALGAISAVLGAGFTTGLESMQIVLARHLGIAPCNVARWNDAPGRTASDVITALRAAAGASHA